MVSLFTQIEAQTSQNFTIVTTPASCPTCCDGSASIGLINTNCNGYAIQWTDSSGYLSSSSSINNCCAGNSYTATVYSACGQEVFFCSIFSQSVTNVHPYFNENKILVYPNPTNGLFEISISNSEKYILQIRNAIGQIIQTNILHEGKTAIDLSSEEIGIYFYQIFDGKNSIKTDKLIIIK